MVLKFRYLASNGMDSSEDLALMQLMWITNTISSGLYCRKYFLR